MPHEQRGPLAGARRIVTRLRSRGIRELATLLLARVRENLWSSETLVFYVGATADEPLDTGDMVARFATTDDGPRYARDIGTDSATTFRQRLDRKTRCFLVEEGGRFLHSSWVTTGRAFTREIRGYLAPPPGDAYVYESFTRSDARGRGIYPLALAALLHELAREEVGRLWVGVEDSNTPSRRAIAKAGLEVGFSLRYARRLGWLRLKPPAGPLEADGRTFLRYR